MCLLFNIIREMLLFNIINEKLLFGALRLRQSFFPFFCPWFPKLSCQTCASCLEQLLYCRCWGLLWVFFFFPPFGGSPRHVAFPSVLASVSQAHLVCTDQSENPMPHPFQNNLCAAMLNIQAIYAGRGYRDHQRQALSAQWKNTPHSQAILHYSLWLIMLPCVCFIYSASAHIGMVNDSLPRQVYLEIALQQYF